MALAVLNLASQARFARAGSHGHRRRRTGPTGPTQPTPYLRRHLHGDWGDLSDDDRQLNDARAPVRRRDLLVLQVTHDLEALDHHPEWDRGVTTLLLLAGIDPFRRLLRRSFSSTRGMSSPVGRSCPSPWSITMSLDLRAVPKPLGRRPQAAASPSTSSLRDFVSEFGDELLDSPTAPVPGHGTARGRIGGSSSPAQSRSCSSASRVVIVTGMLVDRGEQRYDRQRRRMGCGKDDRRHRHDRH